NYGWLDTYYTFSFARYFNPERIQFGMLRVLNDDTVAPGMGFGTHPHDNMEIITVPLKGALAHKDSTGHQSVIRKNEVQIMSAGTGITHSEFNHSKEEEVNLLQLWILPEKRNIPPRYEQKTFSPEQRINKIQTIVSPEGNGALWINQQAWLSLTYFEKDFQHAYTVHRPSNGLYVFVIEGEVEIAHERLRRRDGIGIWETDKVQFLAHRPSELLLVEVPMA
ncbi:MAG: pirin family protein, partial [Flammeovirgaceae bacterium]|nr:pirin family protein [Flammeovirgaceae bacterium]MDW8287977.1 pirin family protein [Flammeovirgaceae bacterium]